MRATQLAALSVASLLLPVPLLSVAVNEETAHRLDAMARAETEAVANMTVESSLHILRNSKNLHPDDISLIQEALGAHHRHHKKHHRKHFERHLRHQTSQTSSGYNDVKNAVVKLSDSIKETNLKWELENARCCDEHKENMDMLETLEEGIAQANSQASSEQGEILKANAKITQTESTIPSEKDSLRAINEQCQADKISLEKDLKITQVNLDGLDKMEMTSCDKKALLLQCDHPETGESFLMLKHHTEKHSVLHWQAPAIQRLLKEFTSSNEPAQTHAPIFLQTEEHGDPQKCTMQANPECQQIRDRYLLMTSDLEDNVDELQEKLKINEDNCQKNVEGIEQNIKNAEQNQKEAQTALAESTADYNQAMEASRLKNEERSQHLATMKEAAAKCNENKAALTTEKYGLIKIRGETMKMNGLTGTDAVTLQDCKVTAWIPGECSKPCGGGVRRMRRDVVVPKVLDGVPCPVLVAEEKCNTQKCPVNCEMGEWGGWSACSAQCGGGVFERVRDIKRRGAHGGKPCGATEETQSCNPQSCDKNCALRKWSPWSKCSKACDSGTTFRVRTVKAAAEGQGTCPGKFSRIRMRSKACNKKPCLPTNATEVKTLKCKSKRDVVLVIDGSASLKTSGFAAVKKAASSIVKVMGKDVNVAALVFSGPKTRKNYFKCSGQKWPDRKTGKLLGTPNMETECLVKWVEHFNNNKEEVIQKIDAMAWPRGSSLTSEGLSLAETELDNGRRDAEAVVIVITDGKPMNKRKVAMTAKRLRRKARLMWLTVTTNSPVGLIKKWASVPWQENVVGVPGFKALESKKTINAVVANVCPELEKE